MAPPVERKLTTILSADAAGYSRMVRENEHATLETLKAYRLVMSELIAAYRGRVVSSSGDGLIAEFASVVNAVECAIAIQRNIAERNAQCEEDRRMWFRIGINVGDVMIDGHDLLGDGVNIAARLQALAEPGGIFVSGSVFDHVKDKLAVGFDDLGVKKVKNIAVPVPTYRVVSGTSDSPPKTPVRGAPPGNRHSVRRRIYAMGAKAAALVGLFFAINLFAGFDVVWFQWPSLPIVFITVLRAIWLYQSIETPHGA
jgi:adenylate cyclase